MGACTIAVSATYFKGTFALSWAVTELGFDRTSFLAIVTIADTVVLEADAPGGQASTSSRIENYLGFPIGISGRDLAHRAQVQAQKFGARIIVPRAVVRLVTDSRPYILELDDGTQVCARTVVIATVRATAAFRWPTSTDSRAVASTTPPPRSNRRCAKATTRPSLAGATPPGRPRSSCHVSPTMCSAGAIVCSRRARSACRR